MPSQQPTKTATATTAPLTKDLTLRQRQRRSHKKSRRGCASCKHRRIKCDESKPGCKRCRSFGLECTYEGGVSELTFAGEGCFRLDGLDRLNEVEEASRKGLGSEGGLQVSKGSDAGACGFETGRLPSPRTLSQASTIVGHLSGLPSPPTSGSEDGGLKTSRMAELEILARFNERTVLSVGTRQAAKIYQREVFELACMYPFLQHIVITLTLLHDRHLSGASNIDRRILSHCYQGTSQFKEILMKPIAPETKDALWASAALLGAIQIANFEARTPEEAWPLKPHDPADLDWLKMSEGKKAVFAIASPLRPESRFCHISNGHGALFRPMMEKRDCERGDLVGMTRDFSNIFGLGPDSSGAENPYYEAGMTLARLLHVQCDGDNIVEFFGFMMHLSPEFKRLLARKDAKALLMFAYWYAKLWRGQWWLHRRGLIEGRAICLFLERFHGDDACLQRMLVWPKRELGLDTMNGDEGGGSKWCLSAATVLCVV